MQSIFAKHWHHLPVSEVLDLLETNPDKGLDTFEVAYRQQHFGPNVLTPQKKQNPAIRFLLQLHQPLVYILLASALITAILQEWVDMGVILGVVLLNAMIGFLQEGKALEAVVALAQVITTRASVLRGGERQRIDAGELVPGDIVLLHVGDKVPADLRLIRTRELRIDESTLTGESVPVEKISGALERDSVLAERRNMAYSSTMVTAGSGTGVVVATGDNTEIGLISKLISSAEILATPLTRKIAHFSVILLYVILLMAIVTMLVGVFRGESWLYMFSAAVALAVGAVPEGLPAAMTITLAIGVERMAKRNAIIKRLPAVETLGSTSVICSDKTGTLTRNEMTVQMIVAGAERFSVSGIGYAPKGAFFSETGDQIDPETRPLLMEVLRAGLLCNDALLRESNGTWRIEGDPTEGALIVVARKSGLLPEKEQEQWPRLDTIPFGSERQYMATLHGGGTDKSPVVYLKGSVEALLTRCEAVLGADGERMDLESARIYAQVNKIASKGLRILGFACKKLSPGTVTVTPDDVAGGLVFLGFQCMIDPLRKEVLQAVRACQRAGIQVKMITGDHPGTAVAVARQLNLDPPDFPVLTGRDLAKLSDAELVEAVADTAVFARVSPLHKPRLVEALQARGNIVAMTGDGVNDAPALRRADIGVAMGLAGTEVARQAADMVLIDDNFATIEAAVEEGRGVFDNLIKFMTWTLPTNIGEGLVIMVAVLAGVTLPILPVQILWINMTSAVLLGLMLAFEPKEPGIMKRPPRDPQRPILSGILLFRIVLVGVLLLAGSFGLFKWALNKGAGEAEARTAAVNVFVMGELFYLFNCRSLTRSMFALGLFTNPWLLGGVALMTVLQLLFTYSPVMNRMFHSAPLEFEYWSLILGIGIIIYCVVGLEKWLWLRFNKIR
ncbi:cation-transporting P-type ATPase [Desulfovulcanus sp.]